MSKKLFRPIHWNSLGSISLWWDNIRAQLPQPLEYRGILGSTMLQYNGNSQRSHHEGRRSSGLAQQTEL